MRPGSRGPDVRQLEGALARMGFSPGSIDGRYDGGTAAAVASWYERNGWAPFGSTDTQLDQLRTARAAAAAARDALLQSRVAIQTAKERATPGEIAQARIDLETARQAVDTAEHDRSAGAREVSLALANQGRDNAQAAADVTTKQAALSKARDAQVEAQRNVAEAPADTSASEKVKLQAGVRQAADDVAVAQAELNTSNSAVRATREAGGDGVARARAEVRRARRALPKAQRQVVLASRRLQILRAPGDSSVQEAITRSAAREARGTATDVARLAGKMGIQVPANEVLFFGTLPLRVDSVRVRRGDSVTGRVMTVSNSRLAIDSSLSIDDAKLVRAGASVRIEEPDLGVRTTGIVSQVADRPGTHKVDPGRMYLEVAPSTAPAQLVGASVKLTIAVKSTKQAVLAVPVTALSVGADGSSRVQVERPDGPRYVIVAPGLAAQGLVEVRAVRGRLAPGDLVIVGAKGAADGATGSGSGTTGTTGGNLKNPPGGASGGSQGSTGSTGTTSGTSPGGTTSGGGATSGATP